MTKTADNKKQKKDKIDYALRSTLVPKRVLVKTGFPSADAVLESLRILNVVTTESVLAVCSTPDFPFTGAVPEASAKLKEKYIPTLPIMHIYTNILCSCCERYKIKLKH